MKESALDDLVRLDASSIEQATLVLVRSFQDDPMWSYFIPRGDKRRKLISDIFAIHLRNAIKCGEVYAPTSNLEGIAAWIPSDKLKMTIGRLFSDNPLRLFFQLGIHSVMRMIRVETVTAAVRQRQAPPYYYYLSPVAVDPRFQGQGYASRLIKPMLARLQAEKIPCFLETQSERNVAMYGHFGFRILEKIDIPGVAISHWAMVK